MEMDLFNSFNMSTKIFLFIVINEKKKNYFFNIKFLEVFSYETIFYINLIMSLIIQSLPTKTQILIWNIQLFYINNTQKIFLLLSHIIPPQISQSFK